MTDLRSEATAGTVVQTGVLPGDQIILQVHNGHLTVQPAGKWETPVDRIQRTTITHVVRPPNKGDMRQVSEFYRSRRGSPAEQAEQAEEGAVMATATAKKRTTSKKAAPARKAPAKAATPAKAPEPQAEPQAVESVQPTAAMKAKGVKLISGRNEAKQKINFAIVEDVLVKDADVEAVAKKHGIGTAQVRKIVGIAKGELDMRGRKL